VNNVNSPTANALRGGWTYNRDVTPRFFVATLNTYEHDQFQNLRLRFVAGGGFGVNVIKHGKATLSLAGGGDYERENFTNVLQRNSAEANFAEDLTYKFSAATSLTEDFHIFPNLSDTGQYRMNFDLSAVTAIKKWLAWHVTASDRYLSDPVLGHLRNDVLLSTGLRLSFAR
jgi:putative salt-induced outer membrane protein